MKKKWFTLIEMLIVIVIIGILLSLSMWISWDRIRVLKTKSVTEQFIYNYNNLYSKNLLTNYYDWEMYENLVIRMSKWDEKLRYYYKLYPSEDLWEQSMEVDPFWLSERVQWWTYVIDKIFFNGNKSTTLNDSYLVFDPYKIWCKILSNYTDEGASSYNTLNIDVLVNTNNKYCFKISSNLCKLETIDCE